ERHGDGGGQQRGGDDPGGAGRRCVEQRRALGLDGQDHGLRQGGRKATEAQCTDREAWSSRERWCGHVVSSGAKVEFWRTCNLQMSACREVAEVDIKRQGSHVVRLSSNAGSVISC